MRTKYISLCIWLIIATALPCHLFSQNLVPNPSFENLNGCPNGLSSITYSPTYSSFPTVQYWINPLYNTSPDYFHTCAAPASGVHIPEANFGYQLPRTGSAYAGLIVWEQSGSSSHFGEYIECKLTTPMIAGREYCVSFYVSPTITPTFQYNYMAIDEIGAHFSTSQISQSTGSDLVLPYHIQSAPNNFMYDTTAWIKVYGIYKATGGEEWMTIGRFNNSGTIPNNKPVWPATPDPNLAYRSYMYLDDVAVYMIGPSDTMRRSFDYTYCNKASLPMVLASSGNNGIYQWSNGSTAQAISVNADGTYTCKGISGCAVYLDTFIVKYAPDLKLDLGGQIVSCDSTPVTITPKYKYSSYKWNTGASTSSIVASTPGKYWLNVTSPCGPFSDTVEVFIQSRPSPPVAKDTAICQLAENPKLQNVKGQNILWYTSELSGIGSPIQPSLYTKESGTYLFYVSQTIGKCESKKVPVVVDIRYQPKKELDDTYSMCAHKPDTLGKFNSGVTYHWSTGGTSCCLAPNHEGMYRRTSSNECGTYTDSTMVYFSPCDSCIAVPNAFSPNADGINDKFFAIYKCPVTNFHITIYNRWGQLVFESRNLKQVWNGAMEGRYAEQGVYLYIIEYTPEATGIPNILKGNITLLR